MRGLGTDCRQAPTAGVRRWKPSEGPSRHSQHALSAPRRSPGRPAGPARPRAQAKRPPIMTRGILTLKRPPASGAASSPRRSRSASPARCRCSAGAAASSCSLTTSVVAVYGGMTPDDLRDLARRVGRTTRKEAQHGTRARYVKGCRCPACRGANARGEAARRTAKGRRQLRDCQARNASGSLCRRSRAGRVGLLPSPCDPW